MLFNGGPLHETFYFPAYGGLDKLTRLAVILEMIHNGTADYGEETKGYTLELIAQIVG